MNDIDITPDCKGGARLVDPDGSTVIQADRPLCSVVPGGMVGEENAQAASDQTADAGIGKSAIAMPDACSDRGSDAGAERSAFESRSGLRLREFNGSGADDLSVFDKDRNRGVVRNEGVPMLPGGRACG